MAIDFYEWKNNLNSIPKTNANFEKWLFLRISSVLFSSKSGELLVLKKEQYNLTCTERIEIIENVCSLWGISYMVLHESSLSCKIIIYNKKELNKVLSNHLFSFLCKKLNYPTNIEAVSFLNKVSHYWMLKGKIPHEIGIALGYPIKDVVGFMGYSKQKYNGRCGWQIFGNPKPSFAARERFEVARYKASMFLHGNKYILE